MPDLQFKVEAAEAITSSFLAVCLRLLIVNTRADEQVHSIALTVQVQIEPARRRYSDSEKQALADLFGEPARWSTTVRPLFWTTVNAAVPNFTGATRFDLHVPCALDSDVASAKYIRALEAGEIPVALLFSGRVLYVNGGALQMSPIPWSQEAAYRIPVSACKELRSAPPNRAVWRGTSWM